tara:strand:+ start:114 stop:1094 length:981 start_codon:yes stop_codon:yes gene_type:complete
MNFYLKIHKLAFSNILYMKIFRPGLPLYKRIINNLSHGKGYGKKRSIRKIMSFFDLLFRSNEIDVHGHKMFLTKKGFEEYSTQGVYGKLDTQTVEKLIKPNDYVIDVGAAIGYFTLIFARSVGQNGRVFSFEPKKDRFEILSKNVQVNNYSNVILENKAIMENKKKMNFYERDDGFSGLRFITNPEKPIKYLNTDKHKVPVEITTIDLDEYLENNGLLEKISFMKIDVDGPELLVLQGSKSLLKNENLKIFMEWDKASAKWSGCEPVEIIDLLLENNFKMFYPDYKKHKFFEISKKELLEKPEILDETINMIFVKNSSILEKNNLI